MSQNPTTTIRTNPDLTKDQENIKHIMSCTKKGCLLCVKGTSDA